MAPLFRQLFDKMSSTYTYLLADPSSRDAVIIDPVFEHHHRDLALIHELNLKLLYAIDTHCHADHVTGAWLLKKATGSKILLSKFYNAAQVDKPLEEGDRINFGEFWLEVLSTPGHTGGCLSFLLNNKKMVFTGDALLIRGTGRTDLGGNAKHLYNSIKNKLFKLPEDCLVYPGHDYHGRMASSISEEKHFNARLGGKANETDFISCMDNLKLPHPSLLEHAYKANMNSGMPESGEYTPLATWGPVEKSYDGVNQVEANWVEFNTEKLTLVDLSEEGETLAENINCLANSIKIPFKNLSERLSDIPKSKPVILVCRAGKRSALATITLQNNGFNDVANLKGGLLSFFNEN